MRPPVVEALSESSVACAASLDTLKALEYGSTSGGVKRSSLSVIRTDFMSLLALLRAHSTTLSLAFKPPPSYDAVTRPLSDLRTDVARIAGCLQILAASKRGATFFAHARSQAIVVVDAAQHLLQTFAQMTSIDDKHYLLRMGSLHAAIDECKTSFPNDNLDAVLHSWRSDYNVIKDALNEYKELSQLQDGGDVESDEDDFGDEGDTWDDILGFDTSKKLSTEEAAVAKKCWMIARMVDTLYERTISHYLASLSPSDPALDSLAASSSVTAEAIDNLTTTLYAPQVSAKVLDALGDLQNAVHGLRDSLYVAIGVGDPSGGVVQTLDVGMASLTMNETQPVAPSKDVQWLVNCFAQIQKSIAAGV